MSKLVLWLQKLTMSKLVLWLQKLALWLFGVANGKFSQLGWCRHCQSIQYHYIVYIGNKTSKPTCPKCQNQADW